MYGAPFDHDRFRDRFLTILVNLGKAVVDYPGDRCIIEEAIVHAFPGITNSLHTADPVELVTIKGPQDRIVAYIVL